MRCWRLRMQRARGEEQNSGLQVVAEARRPASATGAGEDVRLLDDLAQGAEVGEEDCGCGAEDRDGEADPGAAGEWYEPGVHAAVELLEEAEKPIGGQAGEQVLIGGRGAGGDGFERRLQHIHGEEEAEGEHLQERRDAQEELPWQEMSGCSLDQEGKAEDEGCGGEDGEPVGGEGAD